VPATAATSPDDDLTTTPPVPLRPPKTAELVAHHLRKRIVRGELCEGESLPSEATLTEQFGVSRPTLREAFRVLETEQLITVRRGARGGAAVHAPSTSMVARYAGFYLDTTEPRSPTCWRHASPSRARPPGSLPSAAPTPTSSSCGC
jgi:GntR family transcriptional regulator, sialic acid-inducible nan operon repressor